jgi:hypothetical protein
MSPRTHVTVSWLLILPFLITGCYLVSFEDVSTQPQYSSYVGKHYRSAQPTKIYRISMEQNYKREPSVYVVTPLPGISGPEVLSGASLPVGTTLQVLKVMRCTDCYLDFKERVYVVVRLISTSEFNDRQIQVDNELLGTIFAEVRNAEQRS